MVAASLAAQRGKKRRRRRNARGGAHDHFQERPSLQVQCHDLLLVPRRKACGDYSLNCRGRHARPSSVGLSGCRFAIPGAGRDAALAQLVFLHLAVLGRRQRVDELDEARHREAGEPRPAEFAQRAFGEFAARPAHDGGHDFVFGQFRRHRKDRGFADVRMAEQHLLDLEGRNILAAAADGVLQAVDETKISVPVAHDAIAGVKPAVAERLGGLVGHGEIAGGEGERLVGVHDQFAGLRPAGRRYRG